jgi:hypothetical protein
MSKISKEKMSWILDDYELVLINQGICPKDRGVNFLNKKKKTKKQKLEHSFYLINKAKKTISKGRKPLFIFRRIQRLLVSCEFYDRLDIKFHNNKKTSF